MFYRIACRPGSGLSIALDEKSGHNFIMYDKNSFPLIGGQIRHLRTTQGMTLQQLADKAGTSVSALHRYETGWDRFEIATLRRIASALGGHLDVRLRVENHRNPDTLQDSDTLVRLLTPLFWDKQLNPVDIEQHPYWVICRVLMYGDDRQVRACRRFFGDELIRTAICQRGVDDRTRGYWNMILRDP